MTTSNFDQLFTCSYNLSMTPTPIRNVFKKGSPRGFTCEEVLQSHFALEFKRSDTKGHDFVSRLTGRPLEVRSVLKTGCVNLAISGDIGGQRKVNIDRLVADTPNKDYCICHVDYDDQTCTLTYQMRFLSGAAALELASPRGIISKRNIAGLFNQVVELEDAE